MAQTRGTFTELYDNVDKAVFTLLFDAQKELKKIWPSVYNIKTSDKKFERVMSVTGMGDVPQKGEGAAYTSDVIRPGWTKDYTHLEYGMMFEVTQTALEDDQYDQLAQHARWLMFSARVVEEKQAHALFNNGFTTEQSPDGVSLFNSAHVLKGGGTARNILGTAADLSATSLQQALVDWQTQTKVEAGQLVAPATDLVLFVPPDLEFTADRILNSTLAAGIGRQRPQPDQGASELDDHRQPVSHGQRCVVPARREQEVARHHVVHARADLDGAGDDRSAHAESAVSGALPSLVGLLVLAGHVRHAGHLVATC